MTAEAIATHSRVASPSPLLRNESTDRTSRMALPPLVPASTNQSRSTMGLSAAPAMVLLRRDRTVGGASALGIRLNGADDFAADRARRRVELGLDDDDGADGQNDHRSRWRHPFECDQAFIVAQKQ